MVRDHSQFAVHGVWLILLAVVLAAACPATAQEARLLITVFDEKTGRPVEDLQSSNFSVKDGKTSLRVVAADYRRSLLDVMLLIDTSALGEVVRPLGPAFIDGLVEKEQMAIVSYHNSADLLQDFTSSKKLLLNSLRELQYGNNPRILDALFAALDGGFSASSAARRVIVLLSAGVEGRSRVTLGEVLRLARRRSVSIYPVFVSGADRRLFRRLAERTGGAYFSARRLKLNPKQLSEVVYSVVRGHYVVEVRGVYTLGDRIEVKIEGLPKSGKKLRASALSLE